MTPPKNYLFLLSFLEGGAVMACELIGAKLLAPYFGASLYVWAAALAVTLGGLTLGYYIGGRLSKRYAGEVKLLYVVLIAAGLLLAIMPFISSLIMEQTIDLSLEMGAVFSLMLFMMPPLAFMGMVSPVIINLLTQEVTSAGNSAGNVYAISTLGGISFTLLMGFWVIPQFGLSMPAVIVGAGLAALPMISLLLLKERKTGIGLLALVLFAFLSLNSGQKYKEEYNILYQSEGILGQVKVVDHPSYQMTDDNRTGRALIVNNTLQTYAGLDHDLQYSIWTWDNYLPTAASIFPKGSKALLLGLGGGTIVKQFGRLGYEVDAVEIDQRIWDVSIEYFNMDKNTNVLIDDARHYIKTTDKKYDIIVYDCFLGEAIPEHLLTIEGFADVKKLLNQEGLILINFYGFIKGERGKAARSVYKTLEEAGFITEILATPGEESTRNLIFLASLKEKDFSKANYTEPNYDGVEDVYDYLLDKRMINRKDAVTLSDKKPQLYRMYSKAAREWKKSYNAYYRRHFME